MENQHKQTRAIINRLSRVEGHVRSIKRMVEEDRDCTDVLVQLSAVRSAINKIGRVVLEDHLESCLFPENVGQEEKAIIAEIKESLDALL
jgi:DNA-binding FrmR family transcriptional regulator